MLHADLAIWAGLLSDTLELLISLVPENLLPQQLALCVWASLIAGVLGTLPANGQLSAGSGSTIQPQQARNAAPMAAAINPPNSPPCPAAGSLLVPPSQPAISHHRVILSWNASSHALNDAGNAAGYCVYRSKDEKAIKQKPTCPQCEQMNSKAVVGTTCVDDLVEDSTTYYYVVTAVNARGEPSSPSNDAPAPIPDGKSSVTVRAGDSIPICREASRER